MSQYNTEISGPVFKLGNVASCIYRKHPSPPSGLDLEELEIFATAICKLNLDKIEKIGQPVRGRDGKVSYLMTKAHRAARIQESIEKPQLAYVQTGQEHVSQIQVSKDSTPEQAIAECITSWNILSKKPPSWVSGTDPSLVKILAERLNAKEIREFTP